MEPLVDISIVIYNQWEHTKRLLKSFMENTVYPNYRVNIIDNGSSDATVLKLEEIHKIPQFKDRTNLIWNENKKSLAACHNMIMSNSDARYVCLLTPDIELSKGWLTKMVAYPNMKKNVGLVAPMKQIWGKNMIGGRIKDDAQCTNVCEDDEDKSIEWLHSCCLLVNMMVVKKIEVFDERFVVKYYEDIDYSIRTKEAGFDLVCASDVIINWYDDELLEWKSEQEGNRVLFVEKNKDWLIKNKGRAVKRQRRRKKQ